MEGRWFTNIQLRRVTISKSDGKIVIVDCKNVFDEDGGGYLFGYRKREREKY